MKYADRSGNSKVSINFSLPEELCRLVTRQAYEEQRSRSSLIVQAIEEYLTYQADMAALEVEIEQKQKGEYYI